MMTVNRIEILQFAYNYNITTNTVAVVGLQRTFYSVDEDDGSVEVCLSVTRPSIGCPVTYPFDVLLITVADTAGKHIDFPLAWIRLWNVCILFVLSGR